MSTVLEAEIPVLGGPEPVMTTVTNEIRNVRGERVGVLAQAPKLMIELLVRRMRRVVLPDFEERLAIIDRAAHVYAAAEVAGFLPDEFARLQAQTAGLPITVAHRHLATIGSAARCLGEAVLAQRATGVVGAEHPFLATPSLAWVRRGDVVVVLAPANHPDVHLTIMEAFAFGYKVVVRPSVRDPFTPARVVAALRLAGAPEDSVALVPCAHEHVRHLTKAGDLAVVYGGDDVVRAHMGDPTVLAQGPGRSKLYATDAVSPFALSEQLFRSFAGDGGTQCVNASAAILPTKLSFVVDDLREQADKLRAAPPEDPAAQLPVASLARAQAMAEYAVAAHGATCAATDLVVDFGDGSAALRPLVSTSPDLGEIAATPELAFPAIRIVSTNERVEPAQLGRTLALAVHSTSPDEQFGRFITSPLIKNVFFGETPTTTVLFGLPHDGSLAHFLMETKTVVHSW